MTTEFEYKTAPFGSVRRLIVEAGEARLTDEAGELLERMPFDRVRSVRYVDTHVRGMNLRRIDLLAGEDRLRLPLNASSGTAGSEEPLATFYLAASALLRALSEARPELELELGESSRARAWMFAVGVLSILMGIGIPGLALATGVSSDKLIGAAIPMLLLLLFGVVVARGNRPWAPLPRILCGPMADVLTTHALPESEGAD